MDTSSASHQYWNLSSCFYRICCGIEIIRSQMLNTVFLNWNTIFVISIERKLIHFLYWKKSKFNGKSFVVIGLFRFLLFIFHIFVEPIILLNCVSVIYKNDWKVPLNEFRAYMTTYFMNWTAIFKLLTENNIEKIKISNNVTCTLFNSSKSTVKKSARRTKQFIKYTTV